MSDASPPAPRRRAYHKPAVRSFGSLAQVTRATGSTSKTHDMSMQGPDKTS